ncbi:HVO_2922 family protein [Halomontanus rarus]|uniref:HVO_2922 family protein n=1 Tax=Halomontanus rarus TaxID=3034020 RepID=UPI001A995579
MPEEIFELERPFERTELAALFQGFASALTDGQPLTVETEDGVVSMDVPERVSAELELGLEFEFEAEGEENGEERKENDDSSTVEFEIELEWEDSSGTSIRTDELVGGTGADETSDEATTEDAASEATGEEGDEPVEGGADQSSVMDQRRSRFEVYRDEADEWRWRLVHWNGNIIADSGEGYTTRRSAVNGLESVRHNAPGATVDHRDHT